jgi:hypothetical protein
MPALSNDITVTINKFCSGGLLAPSAAKNKRKDSQEEMS